MTTDQPNEASIFNTARKISSSEELAAYLTEACQGNPALQERVENLLAAYAEESQFLEQPAPEIEATIIGKASEQNVEGVLEAGLGVAMTEDETMVIGNAGHSVLRSLDNALGEVPRVALRESQTEVDDPISRPGSPEVPQSDSDGRYRLDGEIARGGMGAILKGRDTDLGRDLAIKVLLDSNKDKPEVIQRFVEEAQIGGQLQHPGIAPVYELGQFSDKRPFFAMKLVKGETLAKLLADRESPEAERAKFIGIFEQVCQTMAYAHSRGVIHRDLKPANIMVGAFGEVQVMDWGLAKVLPAGSVADEKLSHRKNQDQSVIETRRSAGSERPGTFGSAGSETQMGSVMGTPAYMPPEQALGEVDRLDERSDVFGLGAILVEVLTGKPPYVGNNGTEVYRMASRGKLEECESRLAACGADAELIALAKHCLEVEPQDRPRDAGEMATQVSGYLESVESKLRETEQQRAAEAARVIEERKRRKVLLALAASVLLLVIGGGSGAWWWQQDQQRQVTEFNQEKADRSGRVREALSEAKRFQLQAIAQNYDPLLITQGRDEVRRAESLLEGGPVEEGLEEEAAQLKTDLEEGKRDFEMVARLEAIPQIQAPEATTAGNQGVLLTAGLTPADVHQQRQAYAWAFADYGLPILQIDVQEAAERIRQRPQPVREALIQGLEQWNRLVPSSLGLLRVPQFGLMVEPGSVAAQGDVSAGNWLVAMARGTDQPLQNMIFNLSSVKPLYGVPEKPVRLQIRPTVGPTTGQDRVVTLTPGPVPAEKVWLEQLVEQADENPWRGQVRQAVREEDAEQLRELVSRIKVSEHPPTDILALASELPLDEAIALLRQAQRSHPASYGLNYQLGELLRKQRENEAALRFLTAALAIRPQSGPYGLIARLMEVMGRDQESLAMLQAWVEASPENADAHFSMGYTLSKQGDVAGTIKMFEKVIQLDPKIAAAHTHLGWALEKQGDLAGAIKSYEKAIQLDPENANAYNNLGGAVEKRGEVARAIKLYEKAIQLDPKNAVAYNNLGLALFKQGELARAIKLCEKAIQLDPKLSNAYNNLGLVLFKQGDVTGAIKLFKKAIQLDPKNANAHSNLGSVLYLMGDLTEAIKLYEKAIQLDPKNAIIRKSLSQALKKQGDLAMAIKRLKKVIQLDPNDAVVHHNLGQMLERQGDVPGAIKSYEKAIELNPKQPTIHFHLGEALFMQGELNLAEQSFGRCVDLLRPGKNRAQIQEVLAMRGLILLQLKKYAAAEPVCRECLAIQEKLMPNQWSLFNSKAQLGAALLGQAQQLQETDSPAAKKKFTEAKPLLLAGTEGLLQQEKNIPAIAKPRLTEALQRLVELHEATNQPEEARKWQAELNKRQPKEKTRKPSVAPKP